MPDLYSELNNLAEGNMYPFHMPGHKRNYGSTPLKGAFRCDITEIDGFDNLHDAKSIILAAEQRAAGIYRSDETHFLVNGSTAGVLSAVSASVPDGGIILADRGSHRSFYHAAYLRHLDIEYLPVKIYDKYGIRNGYSREDIEKCFEAMKKTPEAVFITSPTYEGMCSDIEGIAVACHKRGIPLIVDAAHGAHFGFGEGVPESAVHEGADLVIHSVHKTLPSMTQTALLHIKGELADRDKVRRFLRIYQSSSPSYILMSSIDLCMKEMEERGEEFIAELVLFRKMLEDGVKRCRSIKIPTLSEIPDPAKALIYLETGEMTGQELYDILREEYELQMEMAGERYVLAMLSGWDTESGIRRLINSLIEIDERLSSVKVPGKSLEPREQEGRLFSVPKVFCSLNRAWDSEKETVLLRSAEGKVAGEFINLYPPGIPIIVPGEIISSDLIDKLEEFLNKGMNVQGIFDVGSSENKGIINIDRRGIICVKQR